MKLPLPHPRYDPMRERLRNAEIERADRNNLKRNADVYIGGKIYAKDSNTGAYADLEARITELERPVMLLARLGSVALPANTWAIPPISGVELAKNATVSGGEIDVPDGFYSINFRLNLSGFTGSALIDIGYTTDGGLNYTVIAGGVVARNADGTTLSLPTARTEGVALSYAIRADGSGTYDGGLFYMVREAIGP